MAIDEKVAFYLRHRLLIEEWAALREQAATEMEQALARGVDVIRQRPGTPEIVEDDSGRWPTYGISLQVPDAEPGTVWVALGWTRGRLLKPAGDSWPYMGIKIPGAARGETLYDQVKRQLRNAAAKLQWTQSTSGWVWWNYVQLEAGETDLDDYAVRHVEKLVAAWEALQSEISGTCTRPGSSYGELRPSYSRHIRHYGQVQGP